ncbi:unnamed protein product [Cyprideis torosa]|uniref:Uncharacterized protein n=1 Tax=Cyprideis torosa TaxID=163714 RepID=A0A7R8WFV6_9CRUS|nr:unnamed protein product [Cyprideis torosa]CAG0891041.1 unnamed protein product [Cyprideis torosa]
MLSRILLLLTLTSVFAHDIVKHKSDKEHNPDHEHHDHKVAGRSHHDSPKEGPEYHESLKEGPEYHESLKEGPEYHGTPKEGPEYHESPKEGSEYHDTPKTYTSSHYEPEPYDSSKPYSEKHTDQEWNAYYGQEKPGKFYDDFEFKVIDVNLRNGGRYEANRDWKVDCNTYENYRGNGLYMIAIYDNYDRFGDIDLVKCVGQKDSYGDRALKLDLHSNEVINLSPKSEYYKDRCPYNHVLTALWDSKPGFPRVVKGKCTKLKYGRLAHFACIDIPTKNYDEYRHGGWTKPRFTWKVECPQRYAMTGLKRNYYNIESIRCCPEYY